MKTSRRVADRRRAGGAGFTLVELAIAVAVVFTGVLALFALITAGLESSAKAVADTQGALFADDVFNRLGAENQKAAEAGVVPPNNPNSGTVMWRKFWTDFATRATNITVAAWPVW